MDHQAERLVYVTRNNVLGLLSPAEITRVALAESAPLIEGEEYLDLVQLDAGVRRALDTTPSEHALPRRLLSTKTWLDILSAIARSRPSTP
jgi:hypothetical protein